MQAASYLDKALERFRAARRNDLGALAHQRAREIAMHALERREVHGELGLNPEARKWIHADYTVNEWPQPQLVFSFGFTNLKP